MPSNHVFGKEKNVVDTQILVLVLSLNAHCFTYVKLLLFKYFLYFYVLSY